MKISFNELAVLATAGQYRKQTKDALARMIAVTFASPRTDQMTLLREIESLQSGGYLRLDKDRNIELTRDGWAAVLDMLQPLEQLRALAGCVRFDLRRP